MAEDTIIIDIEVSDQQAMNAIKQATAEVVRLKEEQKKLTAEYKAGNKTREEYASGLADIKRQMTDANSTIKANEKVIKDNAKAMKEAEGSLVQMERQLKAMKKQYAELSAEERNNESTGGSLLKQIQEQDKAVKDLRASMGDHQANVGNYPKVFDLANTSMGKFAAMFNSLSQGTGKLSVAMSGAKQAVAAFGKQLLALLANPIVAVIAAIVAVFMQLVQAFKRSDDAMTSLQVAFAAFQPIITAVRVVLEKVAETLGKIVAGAANVVTAVMRLIPAFREAQDAAQELVLAEDKLQDKEREYTVQSAKNDKQIAELRSKATDREKYSAAEREKFLTEAMSLEEQNMRMARDNARERFEIEKAKQKQMRKVSDEDKDRLADLEAAMYKTEEEYYTGIRRMQREAQTARKEEAKAEEDALKERQRKYQEYLQRRQQMQALEMQYRQAYEDAMIAIMKDGTEKQIAEINLNYSRRIGELKKTLETEKNLTAAAREDINRTIVALEAQQAIEINKVRSENQKKAAAEAAASFKELYNADLDTYLLALKQKLSAAGENMAAAADAEVEYAKQKQQRLAEIDKLQADERKTALEAMGMTETQYAIAMVEANDAVTESLKRQKDVTDELIEKQKQHVQEAELNALKLQSSYVTATSSIISSFSDMLNQVAGDNERMQDFLTAVAIANVAASTASSIAHAVEGAIMQANETGAPAFTAPAFIAEMVGIVLSAIGEASAILKKATTPSAPKFAEGGLVVGEGTDTSDSITAKLSNGEAVINAKSVRATAPLLSAINQMYGGAPIGSDATIGSNDALKSMMADVFAEIHPEVSVKEITRVSNRVRVKENIAKQ